MYGSVAAITVGLQELFESVVFNCPCEGHFAYGLGFLWAPALLLFLLGIVLDKNSRGRHPRTLNKEKAKTSLRRCFKTVFAVFDAFIRAAIAPTAWLVLSLLQQHYYTCTYFGPSLDSAETVQTNTSDKCYFELGIRSKNLEEMYKTRSQIAGWNLLMMAMLVLFTSVCIHRCIQKEKQLRILSLEYYRHVEAKEALEQFHARAKELARHKAKGEICDLFKRTINKDFDSRLKDVGTAVHKKYEQFFIIPSHSPTYGSPESTPEDPPQFPVSPRIAPGLLSDGSEARSLEVQFPSQAYSTTESHRQLARVRLRQDSTETS